MRGLMRSCRTFFSLLAVISPLLFAGCTTNQIEMKNLNAPLVDLQKATHKNMPAGTMKVSTNGREFFSNYFVVAPNGRFVKSKYPPKRYRAHVFILGDRRPYNIVVRVAVQLRNSDGDYDTDHFNKGMARVISRRIQITLHESLEQRNFIDDFRAF